MARLFGDSNEELEYTRALTLSEMNMTNVLSSSPVSSRCEMTRARFWSMRSTMAAYVSMRRAECAFSSSSISTHSLTVSPTMGAGSTPAGTRPRAMSASRRRLRSASGPSEYWPLYLSMISCGACRGQ